MQPDKKKIRPTGNRADSTKVGETSLSLPVAWHEQCEWEAEYAYHEGYAAGWAAAEQHVADEICTALGRPPVDAEAVIRWLIRTTGDATGTTRGVTA
ncbi:hypothetical protein ACFY03_20350 [Micromonospora chersina]|uniref:hypothetical protein n=1 Tax=Micromonospora chersina TaxID=47854 RepID=UPI003684C3CA